MAAVIENNGERVESCFNTVRQGLSEEGAYSLIPVVWEWVGYCKEVEELSVNEELHVQWAWGRTELDLLEDVKEGQWDQTKEEKRIQGARSLRPKLAIGI